VRLRTFRIRTHAVMLPLVAALS